MQPLLFALLLLSSSSLFLFLFFFSFAAVILELIERQKPCLLAFFAQMAQISLPSLSKIRLNV